MSSSEMILGNEIDEFLRDLLGSELVKRYPDGYLDRIKVEWSAFSN